MKNEKCQLSKISIWSKNTTKKKIYIYIYRGKGRGSYIGPQAFIQGYKQVRE